MWWLWGAGDKYILKDLLNQKYFSFLFSLWNLIRPGISYMQFIYIYIYAYYANVCDDHSDYVVKHHSCEKLSMLQKF